MILNSLYNEEILRIKKITSQDWEVGQKSDIWGKVITGEDESYREKYSRSFHN